MAKANSNKGSMGKFILKYLLILFLFSCSAGKKDARSLNCNPFCEGDEWHVQEFKADPYPTVIPFEKNQLISALEGELYFWRSVNKEMLILKGKDNHEITFKYDTNGDTLILSSNKNESLIKLIIKKESEASLNLELIGLFHADLRLQKQN